MMIVVCWIMIFYITFMMVDGTASMVVVVVGVGAVATMMLMMLRVGDVEHD